MVKSLVERIELIDEAMAILKVGFNKWIKLLNLIVQLMAPVVYEGAMAANNRPHFEGFLVDLCKHPEAGKLFGITNAGSSKR